MKSGVYELGRVTDWHEVFAYLPRECEVGDTYPVKKARIVWLEVIERKLQPNISGSYWRYRVKEHSQRDNK